VSDVSQFTAGLRPLDFIVATPLRSPRVACEGVRALSGNAVYQPLSDINVIFWRAVDGTTVVNC
jgi:hypothetical protein